jgi:hypothetical protein
MKIGLFKFSLILFLLTLAIVNHASAKNLLDEKQALDVLVSQIQNDELYANRTSLPCLSFITEKNENIYFDFAIHEKHGGMCPGDPNTSPVVDRFRVNRMTHRIQWVEPIEGKLQPYNTVLESRLGKSLVSKTDIGSGVGVIKVEFVKNEIDPFSGEILVYRVSDSSLIQRITVEDVGLPPEIPPSFEFLDLNDDGYMDLLFQNSRTGTAGAALGSDVYLWVPKLKRFVQSKTLSQTGEITKSNRKGCVQVESKCSITSWWVREFCFNKTAGRWKETPNSKCPEQLP